MRCISYSALYPVSFAATDKPVCQAIKIRDVIGKGPKGASLDDARYTIAERMSCKQVSGLFFLGAYPSPDLALGVREDIPRPRQAKVLASRRRL